jgi:hypothetical protein
LPSCKYELRPKEGLVKQIKELKVKDDLANQILGALSTHKQVPEILRRLKAGEAYDVIVEWLVQVPCKGELLHTEDDDVLSDSDPDLSSSDEDGSSTEDEQGRSSLRKHSAWLPLDEQRLLAYRKEGKSWSWIFRKFLGRTPRAVRTRCHIVQARLPEWHRNKNDEEGADVADEAKPKRRQRRPPKKK